MFLLTGGGLPRADELSCQDARDLGLAYDLGLHEDKYVQRRLRGTDPSTAFSCYMHVAGGSPPRPKKESGSVVDRGESGPASPGVTVPAPGREASAGPAPAPAAGESDRSPDQVEERGRSGSPSSEEGEKGARGLAMREAGPGGMERPMHSPAAVALAAGANC